MYNRVWYKYELTSDNDTKTTNTNSTNHYRRWRCMWNRKSNVDSEWMYNRYIEVEYRSNNTNDYSRGGYLYGLL